MRPPADFSTLWKFLYYVAIVLNFFLCKLRIEGRENVPLTGGCVIASNHTMGPDYVILGYASPRQVYYMAKSELFNVHPLLSKFLWSLGTFPINRGARDTRAIREAVELVQSGKTLGMYPEGSRSRTGELTRGKSGAVRIAMVAQAPLIPVAIIGNEQIFDRLAKFQLRRPEVTIRFGKPIFFEDVNDNATVQDYTQEMMMGIAALLPPDLRGAYDTVFADPE